VATAAAAFVRFGPAEGEHTCAKVTRGAEVAAVVAAAATTGAVGAQGAGGGGGGAEAPGAPGGRRGVVRSGRVALHSETCCEIAAAFATCDAAAATHAWVAAQSAAAAAAAVPAAYRPAFERMGLVQAEMHAEMQAEVPKGMQVEVPKGVPKGVTCQAAAVAGGEAPSEAELEGMHARLRREIRHGLHLMVQESNPDSYYKDVEHVTPT
jgi:hypothetical protein